MINTEDFYNELLKRNFDYFTGVPDSLLKNLCACISDLSRNNHILAANEGNAVAIASGYNIATSHYGVVYMQNSGLGNTINPLLSLCDEKVYKIPMLLIIGYRGESNVKDEPQHIKQGELTLPLLKTLNIKYFILDENYKAQLDLCKEYVEKENKPIALVVKKDTFSKYEHVRKESSLSLTRETSLETIINNLSNDDFIVSTTGKTSREIFEIRERKNMDHGNDFLTVGSMGHTSSIALGISLNTNKNIYCIDGDGSFIMHMGGLAIAAQNAKDNFKYILINNGCHESVGKQPTISNKIDIKNILLSFGFNKVFEVSTKIDLLNILKILSDCGKTAIIINTNDNSRETLGRPTTSPIENKLSFQDKLRSL
ncbi:MAG: phosphonopyruvate decarboxylase [Clostridiaceae bacterium]|nr:phosphonopyruvate decarboxylase [Clostridiaceae bacterium]